MSSFELQKPLPYYLDIYADIDVNELENMNFLSYLETRSKRTKRYIKAGIIFFILGILFFVLLINEVNSTIAEGKSVIFEVDLNTPSTRLYFYSVALSTLAAVGIFLIYYGYSEAKPVRLTDSETYLQQIFKDLSESGENVDDYVVFHMDENELKVRYELKKVKLNWDFQTLWECFTKMGSLKLSLIFSICIWLTAGACLILLLLRSLEVTSPRFYMGVIAILFLITPVVYLIVILRHFISYRSLLKEFIYAQKLEINKLYLEAERNPNDSLFQHRIANAQALLNRLEYTPSHPFKPLVKVVTVIPFLVGILSYLL